MWSNRRRRIRSFCGNTQLHASTSSPRRLRNTSRSPNRRRPDRMLMQVHLRKWYAWADELAKAGRHSGGQPLDSIGKTVRGRNRIVTDGPYAESKDLVTGSLVLEATSLEEATELALDCPVFEFGGSVEVRPVVRHDL